MNLSPHFTLQEAMKSQVALRLGIDNAPPSVIVGSLRTTARRILEPCRVEFGRPITPSSWYRCPRLNRAIRSKSTSQHVKGEAVDFEVPGVSNLDLARFISETLDWDQLILEFYSGDPHSGWVHCSYSNDNRKQVLTFNGKGYSAGLPA